MGEKIKTMSVKEFRELGYLQEINRRFLHPLGLALEVEIDDETGEERFGRIWDYREDPEGIVFGDDIVSKPEFAEKAKRVREEMLKHESARLRKFGFVIQPVVSKKMI